MGRNLRYLLLGWHAGHPSAVFEKLKLDIHSWVPGTVVLFFHSPSDFHSRILLPLARRIRKTRSTFAPRRNPGISHQVNKSDKFGILFWGQRQGFGSSSHFQKKMHDFNSSEGRCFGNFLGLADSWGSSGFSRAEEASEDEPKFFKIRERVCPLFDWLYKCLLHGIAL